MICTIQKAKVTKYTYYTIHSKKLSRSDHSSIFAFACSRKIYCELFTEITFSGKRLLKSRYFHMLNSRTVWIFAKARQVQRTERLLGSHASASNVITVTVGLTRKIRAYGNGVQSGNHYGEIAEICSRTSRRAWRWWSVCPRAVTIGPWCSPASISASSLFHYLHFLQPPRSRDSFKVLMVH